jgi:hypothetical protein
MSRVATHCISCGAADLSQQFCATVFDVAVNKGAEESELPETEPLCTQCTTAAGRRCRVARQQAEQVSVFYVRRQTLPRHGSMQCSATPLLTRYDHRVPRRVQLQALTARSAAVTALLEALDSSGTVIT